MAHETRRRSDDHEEGVETDAASAPGDLSPQRGRRPRTRPPVGSETNPGLSEENGYRSAASRACAEHCGRSTRSDTTASCLPGSAPTMSTRRWRRGRPRDRARPLQHLRSPRTHRGPLGPADDPGIGSKIKKKPPTSIIPGDAGTHHRAVQRNRLRCTTSTSGVDHKPIEEVASTDFLQRGQRQESVFESVSSLENDCRQDARS